MYSIVTYFDELDQRIAKTKSQKENLVVVLDNLYVPLHNNHSELAARTQASRRLVSVQTQNKKRTTVKDACVIKLKIDILCYTKIIFFYIIVINNFLIILILVLKMIV